MNNSSDKSRIFLISLALALATLALFWQVRNFDFIHYDDTTYIKENPHVQAGLTPDSIIWAFTTSYASNWHPVTWLSHMLDCQLYDLSPAGHHFTNLLLHIANTVLLFLIFYNMTNNLWPSAFVAAAFALHPLHVESVAWVSERKDVLSTFFGLLTIIAYLRFVRTRKIVSYLLMMVLFALCLMSKPMLVTLPFVLLLLDYWPLQRFEMTKIYKLVREKIPLFVLSSLSCVMTLTIEQTGAGASFESISLKARIINAPLSYVTYIEKMFWPAKLAALYPHPADNISISYAMVAALILLIITVFVIKSARSRKYLLAGWLWFLGTLIPVIGIVQVGSQAMADRYTYIPLTGLFIIIAWGTKDLLAKYHLKKIILPLSAVLIFTAMLITTNIQLKYWQNSLSLFTHAIEVTKDNYIMHNNLGSIFLIRGKLPQAIDHYKKALQIRPNIAKTHDNLARALKSQGKLNEAIDHYRQVILITPDSAKAHCNLADALKAKASLDEAIDHYRQAINIAPNYIKAHYNLASALVSQNKTSEAVVHYRAALKIKPDSPVALNSLAWILATTTDTDIHNPAEAVALASRAVELTGQKDPYILDTLVAAYASAEMFDEAIATAQIALNLAVAQDNDELTTHIQKQLQLYKQKTAISK